MLDTLLSLPGWALAALVGLLAALFGVGLMRLLRRSGVRPGLVRYLPLILAALGYGVADRFVVPAVLEGDAALCATATDSAKQATTIRNGTRPDAATAYEATTADCAAKRLSARYTTTASRADIDKAGLARAEAAFLADTCGQPALRRLIAAGWTVESVYDFGSGEPLVLTARC